MILQEAFQNNFYTDLLSVEDATVYGIDLEDLFDPEHQPSELLNIFISKERDDLFLLLNGDSMEINTLCDQWDDRIRVFSIINRNSDAVKKLKYNIVQLIVCSGDTPDKSREGNLIMSRKIILKGDLSNKMQIIIDDDEAIELPFHMIPADAFAPDAAQTQKLRELLPEDDTLLTLLKKPLEKATRRKDEKGNWVQPMNYEEQHFTIIKEWLEK